MTTKQIENAVSQGQLFWKNYSKRLEILGQISDERERQDKKWGQQNHEPNIWCMILGEEVGEIQKAALEAHFNQKDLSEYRNELIQTGAVIFSMIECLDKNTNNQYVVKREED